MYFVNYIKNYIYRKIRKSNINENDIIRAGIVINSEDIDKALEKARADHSDSIGAPKVNNIIYNYIINCFIYYFIKNFFNIYVIDL